MGKILIKLIAVSQICQTFTLSKFYTIRYGVRNHIYRISKIANILHIYIGTYIDISHRY